MLDPDHLRDLVTYDPSTGIFVWAKSRRGCRKGDRAGCCKRLGGLPYWVIGIDRHHYKAGRLAWFWMTGEWPDPEIDHRNRDSTDDRWSNLREATRSKNVMNTRLRSDSTSGHRGVSWCNRTSKWRAHIVVDGRFSHLGYFETAEQAALIAQNSQRQNFGAFAPR